MKTLEDLQNMLIAELLSKHRIIDQPIDGYFNDYFQDSSILICSILTEHLLDIEDWDAIKWLDDSLITRYIQKEDKIRIWGIIIWGRENTLQQWTDPFYLEIKLNNYSNGFLEYTYLFGEVNSSEVTYEDFNLSRNMWDKCYYSDQDWNPSERKWDYIINYKNENIPTI